MVASRMQSIDSLTQSREGLAGATGRIRAVSVFQRLGRFRYAALTAAFLFPALAPGNADRQPTFLFQSGFWINLHHFLFQHAVEQSTDDQSTQNTLAAEQARDWAAAVNYYRKTFDGKDLLRRDMTEIKNALADAGNNVSLVSSGLDSALIGAIEMAAPVYRAIWWREHDRSNRSRIDQLLPLVAQHDESLKNRLSDVYKTEWPDVGLRVDIVFHANWAGAYTTLYPTRITISSEDSTQPSEEGLEILYHEASHALVGKVRAEIGERVRSLGKLLRRKSLWHAVLFYSTGEIVRRRIPGYTPYAVKHRLWERVWPDHFGVLETEWKPYLDGHRGFHAAIGVLVDRLVIDP